MCSQSARGVPPPPPHQDDNRYLSTMITKPPRPPSWRDFVGTEPVTPSGLVPKKGERKGSRNMPDHLGFSDLSLAHRSRSEGNDLSRLGLSSSASTTYLGGLNENRAATLPHLKHHKKHKNRLHRTRSQYSIEKAHLPDSEHLTLSLAEAKPKEIGLRSKRPVDARIQLDENTRKCERWLAGVRPPAFTQEMGIPEEHSSDQDSSTGATKGGGGNVTLTSGRPRPATAIVMATSSGSDIDSASVYGIPDASRTSPQRSKVKSNIPVLDKSRKQRVSQKDKSVTDTLRKDKSPPVSTDDVKAQSRKTKASSPPKQKLASQVKTSQEGVPNAKVVPTPNNNNKEPANLSSSKSNKKSENAVHKTGDTTTIVNNVASAPNNCDLSSNISQEQDGQNNNKTEVQDFDSIAPAEDKINKTDKSQPTNCKNHSPTEKEIPANNPSSSKGGGRVLECYNVPGYVESGSDYLGQVNSDYLGQVNSKSPEAKNNTDNTGSQSIASLLQNDLKSTQT